MSAEKFLELQTQMRTNQSELQSYLKDLDSWSTDIRAKESSLKQKQENAPTKELPPVRNSLDKKKKRKKKKPTADDKKKHVASKKISGYDFRAWDQFDVDKACEEVDTSETRKDSSSDYETDDEWEELRQKQQAILMKDQGNQYFKEGNYEKSIECYTRGISCDRTNALLPANRAMALIKKESYGAAELDCTVAISLDPTYLKAYQRRGTARTHLKKFKDAKEDFQHVIKMEPNNKLAKAELEKLEKLLNPPPFSVSTDGEAGIVKPIYKSSQERSKKPLRRVPIEEIGDDAEELKRRRETAAAAKRAEQSASSQRILERDNRDFDDRFSVASPASPADIGKQFSAKEQSEKDESAKDDSARNDSAIALAPNSRKTRKEQDVSEVEGRPTIPAAPSTSFQFQADWKMLKHSKKEFFEYFRGIDPATYPKLFGEFLDAEVLMRILSTLQEFYISNSTDPFPTLLNLTKVKRFNMTVMFFSAKEKTVINSILDYMKSQKIHEDVELQRLSKLYEL